MEEPTCRDCGALVEPPAKGKVPQRCPACTRKERARRVREKRRAQSPWNAGEHRLTTCRDCGVEIKASWQGQLPKRCSECDRKDCARRVAALRARRYSPPDSVYVCVDCNQRAPRKSPNGPLPKRCEDCAEAYAAKQATAWRQGSKAQRRAYEKRWRARNPEKVRAKNHKRRAALWRVAFEIFTSAEIFERDGWVCQLCGYRIDPSVKWPHPRSASLDHIVPVSKHGPHTRENTQLACLCCNLAKKDKLVA